MKMSTAIKQLKKDADFLGWSLEKFIRYMETREVLWEFNQSTIKAFNRLQEFNSRYREEKN
tara:strand:- start:313 stop:495 length:183 start_codon:yes stop_codon:yes gene_type:complete